MGYFLRQDDAWVFNKYNTGLGYDDQLFIDFYSMWKDLLEEGVEPGPEILAEEKGMEDSLLVHGRAPIFSDFSSNQIVGLQSAVGRPLKMAPLPSIPGKTDGHYIKPAMSFSISLQSNQKEAAAKFIDFITNDLEANEILAAERGVPISKAVRDHLYPKLTEYEQMQFDYIEKVQEFSSPMHPIEPAGLSEIIAALDRGKEELDYGVITV